ncbi:MAG: ABC transporter ATP-binding protein [Bradymonadales bacterium]|jgi:ABC-2 type transport system ATP-binding protein
MIEITKLSHHYGEQQALTNINLHIERGEIVALVGCNGAGKSTLMKILTTAILPSEGSVKIAGHDIFNENFALKSKIGYLPENNPLYDDMLVYDSLKTVAMQRALRSDALKSAMQRVVERCGLSEIMHKRVGELSKGLRQRLGFAQAVVHEPEVVLLDEPSSGLDPIQIEEMRQLIRELGSEKTVILSTHILQEVDALATRLIILHKGELRLDAKRETLYGDKQASPALLQSIFENSIL